MIIGITGTIAAGKGTVAEILAEKGFKHYSVRKFLVKEIKKRGMPVNRPSMQTVADDLRKKNRPSYILEELYKQANGQDAVLESIRNSHEIERLRELEDFVLLAVDANRQMRFERVKERGNESDHIDFETFIKQEDYEMDGKEAHLMNIKTCLRMADYTIINEGTIDELKEKVDRFLETIKDEKD